jgi:predicted small lipoprotein YifL
MRKVIVLLAALSIAALAGCGPGGEKTYPVTGKVTYPDGTPLAGARVSFESTSKPISGYGTTDANGAYKITTYTTDDGVVEGEHRVLVMPPSRVVASQEEGEGSLEEPKGPPAVDPKFSNYSTSGLSVTVTESTTYDIKVERGK